MRIGDCWTPDAMPNSLRVSWIRKALNRRQSISTTSWTTACGFHQARSEQLPVELGEGYAAYFPIVRVEGQQYQVTARFPCGGKDPACRPLPGTGCQGQGWIRDMIELMRIAQKRYGQLYKCTPGK